MRDFDAADLLKRWPRNHTKGDVSLLRRNLLGIIWPGSFTSYMSDPSKADVSAAIEAVRELRDAGVAVASGFDSSMEPMSVDLLLDGKQSVVVCLSKAIACYQLPSHWRKAIDAGRLLVVCPFPRSVRRLGKARVRSRKQFMAVISSAVLIPYASPERGDETIARDVVARDKPLFTLGIEENATLMELGARRYNINEIRRVTLDLTSD